MSLLLAIMAVLMTNKKVVSTSCLRTKSVLVTTVVMLGSKSLIWKSSVDCQNGIFILFIFHIFIFIYLIIFSYFHIFMSIQQTKLSEQEQ